MADAIYEKLVQCYNSIKDRIPFQPKVALVLGSGLGDFAESSMKVVSRIGYHEINGFPVSTVPGHKGQFVFGYVVDVPVVCMQGRVHYYEGYDISDVVLPTRLMSLMGAEYLFLTNASGGINSDFWAGDLMLITDHISLFVPNPLIGPNIDELGTRFPDMSTVYDKKLQELIKEAAAELDIDLKEGIFAQLTGPSFETPAEIRLLKTLGADAVAMSTVVEAIAARHCGMKICGISCVCNMAAGISATPLSHEEVQAAAAACAPVFKKLLSLSIVKMGVENPNAVI
ncbi:MAG TPA: purine-nucleoside phosphorylase [Lachnospiraceae bacterium]|nr:purine-nucleoside phosphorylase [Lachnospiraceae bacterium]